MKNLTTILTLIIITTFSFKSYSQCSVTSTNGYTVNIEIKALELITPSSCQWGYNYNVKLSYDISFSGNNVPSNMYTLQADLSCGAQSLFFSLPLTGGQGTVTTATNPFRSQSDCQTATVASLDCRVIKVKIEGPGIQNQTFNCNITALPVEMISFNANPKDSDVQLSWSTASEVNNQYFSIERSYDGLKYNTIATIEGAGNSQSIKKYNYLDQSALALIDKCYYRVKQTDFNGEFSYSTVTIARSNSVDKQVIIYPNPSTTNQFTIALGNANQSHTINIYTANGTIAKSIDTNESSILVNDLNKGFYVIEVIDQIGQTTERIKFIQK